MKSKKILLLRHGETDWNIELRFQGRRDIMLNERGEEQARRVAQRVKAWSPEIVLSSPLLRALKTAEIASADQDRSQSVRDQFWRVGRLSDPRTQRSGRTFLALGARALFGSCSRSGTRKRNTAPCSKSHGRTEDLTSGADSCCLSWRHFACTSVGCPAHSVSIGMEVFPPFQLFAVRLGIRRLAIHSCFLQRPYLRLRNRRCKASLCACDVLTGIYGGKHD